MHDDFRIRVDIHREQAHELLRALQTHERDGAAGKRIESELVAPRIEEKGAVAGLGPGLEREVELFGHRFRR